jgi:hypothetical protein
MANKGSSHDLTSFNSLSKGYSHYDRLSRFRRRLLNLTDQRLKMSRWQSTGHSVGSALTGTAEKETPYILLLCCSHEANDVTMYEAFGVIDYSDYSNPQVFEIEIKTLLLGKIQDDQKVSVHLMITVQKTHKIV